MTMAQEFGFQADPAPMALSLMRSIWVEDPDMPLNQRIDLIDSLMVDDSSSADELVTWIQRAIQD